MKEIGEKSTTPQISCNNQETLDEQAEDNEHLKQALQLLANRESWNIIECNTSIIVKQHKCTISIMSATTPKTKQRSTRQQEEVEGIIDETNRGTKAMDKKL